MKVPRKIKVEVEKLSLIAHIAGLPKPGESWQNLTRTIFERVARRINQEVTKSVISNDILVKDFLLFGQDEFENIKFKYGVSDIDQFMRSLGDMNEQRPYLWISGKTLQSYWNGGNAKDKKLNVLLVFLGIHLSLWDDYKELDTESSAKNEPFIHQNGTLNLIRKHFLGHYYRYYQKSDFSQVLVKAPFVIREDGKGAVKVETRTMGHRYSSSYLVIRDGALYIECENLDWNEKETYIFNVGFESNVQVMVGVSNTLNRKGQAIALKNVLVKQSFPYDFGEVFPVEIPFDPAAGASVDDSRLINFFKNGSCNVIVTDSLYSLDELDKQGTSQLSLRE